MGGGEDHGALLSVLYNATKDASFLASSMRRTWTSWIRFPWEVSCHFTPTVSYALAAARAASATRNQRAYSSAARRKSYYGNLRTKEARKRAQSHCDSHQELTLQGAMEYILGE